MKLRSGWLAAALLAAPLSGCVVYEAVPAYTVSPSTFERAYDAALGAMRDTGVEVTSASAADGMIRGSRNGLDVAVLVARQADGRTRVQFDVKGPAERDPGLANRLSQAYERRMGR
jgi:hypothetical protein